MRSPARLLLIGLALPLALLGQPGSVTPTNSALTVNTSTGAVVAPVTAATFRSANDIQPLDADLTSWAGVTRAAGFDAFTATPSSANLRAAVTDETGTGAAYFQGGDLGTPASATLTNATGLPVSTGLAGLGTNVATWLSTPSSANLAAALTDETGTGALAISSGGLISLTAGGTNQNITLTPSGTGRGVLGTNTGGRLTIGLTGLSSTSEVRLGGNANFDMLWLNTGTRTWSVRGDSSGNPFTTTFDSNGGGVHNVATTGSLSVGSTTASTSTTTGSATFAGGIGVAGAINAGNGITANNSIFLSSRPSAANGAEVEGFRADLGTDGTLAALAVSIGGLPSATGSSRYGFIGAGDAGAWRTFYVGGRATGGGPVIVPGGSITGGASGLTLNAGGTNQNITLTPSGTGILDVSKPTATVAPRTFVQLTETGTAADSSQQIVARNSQQAWDQGAIRFTRRSSASDFHLDFIPATSGALNAASGSMRLTNTGNLLLGTTTDNGERLQVNGSALFGGTGNVAARVAINNASDTVPAIGLGSANFGWGFLERLTEGDLVLNRRVSGVSSDVMRFTRADGRIALSSTTASTSTTTGALTVAGGIGVAGNVYAAGYLSSTSNARVGDSGSVVALSANNPVDGGLPAAWTGNFGLGVRYGGSSFNDVYIGDGSGGGVRFVTRTGSADTTRMTLDATNGALTTTGQVNAPTLRVNSTNGTATDLIASATATLDFGSIAAGGSADLTITVTGASTGDSVSLGLPAAPTAGIIFQGFVSAANTVTVRASNITGSPVDPASATYRATVMSF